MLHHRIQTVNTIAIADSLFVTKTRIPSTVKKRTWKRVKRIKREYSKVVIPSFHTRRYLGRQSKGCVHWGILCSKNPDDNRIKQQSFPFSHLNDFENVVDEIRFRAYRF
ncbi:hypothetical protein TNIN_22121 [Trichonephila inaurata madagascariensis]|uniref:Uncharacterized protein n=1 Tax=Trichonephila inaurata madagascariensis TaxID=2747483 RepID=A0A8X6Y9K2_9ARAC|nr:hypothetical protein TNIN_22121 [Trichonephila inaurata madagascariensis]